MQSFLILIVLVLVNGCTTAKFKPPENLSLQKNEEFENQVEIKEVPVETISSTTVSDDSNDSNGKNNVKNAEALKRNILLTEKDSNKKKNKKSEKKEKLSSSAVISKKTPIPLPVVAPLQTQKIRLPVYEDNNGFDPGSRRPIKDPFHINEKVVLECSYMGAAVGELTLEVMPFVEVNKRKSYRWVGRLKTNDFFSKIFLVDDSVEVLSDFETLVPTAYRLHVKEEKQLKESRAFYKADTNEATYWENKWTEKDGDTNKKLNWLMEPFAQNYFSTLFYMRVFKYEIGKEYMFMLSENEKNTRYKNLVVRKEKLNTAVGTINTIVLKPQIEADGAYKPVGDSYIWVTDDDRKLIVKIAAALKFGTLVFEIKTIDYGMK